MNNNLKTLLIALALIISGEVKAQNPLGYINSNPTVLNAPNVSLPPSPTEQGQNGFIIDPEFNLRSVQEIWNENSTREESIKRFPFDPSTTYPVQMRQNMASLIVLPEGEVVNIVALADDTLFNYVYHGSQGGATNMLSFSGTAPGSDTSAQVITQSKRVYSFYLRNDPVDSKNVPILTMYITDPSISNANDIQFTPINDFQKILDNAASSEPILTETPLDISTTSELEKAQLDYLESLDLSKDVNINYRISGDVSIAPLAVYDDGDFVYMDFNNIVRFGELPVVHRIVDGIDERVNTEWDDEKQRYIIKTLSLEGFTLRSGDKVVCIKPS